MNNSNQANCSNQSLDYDSWVTSLGNIPDGFFQNTPISNHIIQQNMLQQQQQQQQHHHHNNQQPTPTHHAQHPQHLQHQHQQLQQTILPPNDMSFDMFFNSPERFYRDIINESPILSRTPQVGRTPLRNLPINSFSTPNFLKTLETSNGIGSLGTGGRDSISKSFTPLKNQVFNANDIFKTPGENMNKSTTLNSSPTTIKMNSSAIKGDDLQQPQNPPSPTPVSKVGPSIPKMGCFKKEQKSSEPPKKPVQNQTKFQIIMTDVNSFAATGKSSSKNKKKKLTRSSTTVNNTSIGSISKKNSLKRTMSQPQAKLDKVAHDPNIFDKSPTLENGLKK